MVILTFYTCSVRVALQGRRTDTHSTVVVHPADCPGPALLQSAGVATFLSYTCEVKGTFRI